MRPDDDEDRISIERIRELTEAFHSHKRFLRRGRKYFEFFEKE